MVRAGILLGFVLSVMLLWGIRGPEHNVSRGEAFDGRISLAPPVSSPGPDQTVTGFDNCTTAIVLLDGSGSSDPDGYIVSYEWSENGAVITTEATSQVMLEPGEYTFTLQVRDNDGLVDSSDINVHVLDRNRSHQIESQFDEPITDIAWHPEGQLLAVTFDADPSMSSNGDETTYILSCDGIIVSQLDVPPEQSTLQLHWNADGSRLAANTFHTEFGTTHVFIWDTTAPFLPVLLHDFPDLHPTAHAIAWGKDKVLAISRYTNVEFWDTQTNTRVSTITDATGGIGNIVDMAWNADNTRLAVSDRKNAYIWDTEDSPSLIQTLPGEVTSHVDLVWSPDGNQLAFGHAKTIEIWELNASTDTYRQVTSLDIGQAIVIMDWQHAKLAASVMGNKVNIWDTQTWELESMATTTSTRALKDAAALSPGASHIALANSNNQLVVRAFPTANPGSDQTLTDADNDGTELVTLNATASIDPDGTIGTYEWLENGVVIAEGENPQVELEVGEHTITLKVTDNDGLVDVAEVVIEVVSGDGDKRGQSPVNRIFTVAWSPDGSMLAKGGIVADVPGIWLYDASGQFIKQLDAVGNVPALSWCPDSTRIAARTGPEDSYSIYDVSSGTVSLIIEQLDATDNLFIYWSPDGSRIATVGGHVVFVRDAMTGDILSTLISPGSITDSVYSVAWSHDNTNLLTVGINDMVRIWDVGTATLITEYPQVAGATSMDVSPDEIMLAIGNHDSNVRIIDTATGTLLNTLQGAFTTAGRSQIMYVQWHPDGDVVAGASYDYITIWNATTGEVINTLPQIENSVPEAMDYSPDGVLAYAGESGSIRMVPVANPGPDQTLTDTDNDGMIERYEWLENGVVIAEGENPQVEFGVGEHTITLKVTDYDGLVDVAEVVIEVVD